MTPKSKYATKITQEMVGIWATIQNMKCFACGAMPWENCLRSNDNDCGREYDGGQRHSISFK